MAIASHEVSRYLFIWSAVMNPLLCWLGILCELHDSKLQGVSCYFCYFISILFLATIGNRDQK